MRFRVQGVDDSGPREHRISKRLLVLRRGVNTAENANVSDFPYDILLHITSPVQHLNFSARITKVSPKPFVPRFPRCNGSSPVIHSPPEDYSRLAQTYILTIRSASLRLPAPYVTRGRLLTQFAGDVASAPLRHHANRPNPHHDPAQPFSPNLRPKP